MSFIEEMLLLRNTYEEEENAQRALMCMNQIRWNGQAHTLDKLYADIRLAWLMVSPETDFVGFGVFVEPVQWSAFTGTPNRKRKKSEQ